MITTSGTTSAHDLFVPGIGQYENIGDIILRRQLLGWLRPLGRLHVYVGSAHEGYAEGLGLQDSDVCYSSFARWYAAGMRSAANGTAHYVFKPGEIQLSLAGLKEHVAMLPLALLLKLRGGRIVRAGAGTRNKAALPRMLMWPSIALADRVWWRDPATAAYFGVGQVMPDLAFGEGDDPPSTGAHRGLLSVSMRGDRPALPQSWIDGVKQFASDNHLQCVVVTQVARDAARSAELAHALGAQLVDWDGKAHAHQEALLRDVYRQSLLAVSDRLHVLISAFTHGAIPAAAQNDGADKIARHFAAAGIHDMAFDSTGMGGAAIAARLQAARDAGPAMFVRLGVARIELQSVREEIAELLAPTDALLAPTPKTR
ncbi:MAG: polysaccharide pyruvyl transferase family protein [Rubrivivax sp.]